MSVDFLVPLCRIPSLRLYSRCGMWKESILASFSFMIPLTQSYQMSVKIFLQVQLNFPYIIVLFCCICMCICECLHVCVYDVIVSDHASGDQWTNSAVVYLFFFPSPLFFFFKKGLSLIWTSLCRLRWLVIESQTICLPLIPQYWN